MRRVKKNSKQKIIKHPVFFPIQKIANRPLSGPSESHSANMKKQRVLVVGQTPPPYHGQAMMTQRLLDADFEKIELYHVRMAFSKSEASIGTFQLAKLFHMVAIVGRVIRCWFRHRVETLYYMPAGPNLTPVLRDIFILTLTRPLFKHTIFHFRASGLSEFVETRSGIIKRLARWAYRSPDVAIHLSARNPDDGGYFGAHHTEVVPNGLEDAAQPYLPFERTTTSPVRILFVGLLCESKGVMTLLAAVALLHQEGLPIHVSLVGGFTSPEFQKTVESYCRTHHLLDIVDFAGVQQGEGKWQYFQEADIFCFPSHYESESFGNVAVEAMMFSLPVVATHWRGIPDIVEDGQTGHLVPIKDPTSTAAALRQLIQQPDQRHHMGEAGRAKFVAQYQLSSFIETMENVLTIPNPQSAVQHR